MPGRLEVGGEAVGRADPLLARALGIAGIYQQPALFPDLTVAENIAMGLEAGRRLAAHRLARSGARGRRELLARAGRAHRPRRARSGALRMAEQQLVEIARALGAERAGPDHGRAHGALSRARGRAAVRA